MTDRQDDSGPNYFDCSHAAAVRACGCGFCLALSRPAIAPQAWKRLGHFDRFAGLVGFDVGGVTLHLSYDEACIVDGILERFIASRPAIAPQGWPFVESPGEFTERLAEAMEEFPLLGAVRHVLIEEPPTPAIAPQGGRCAECCASPCECPHVWSAPQATPAAVDDAMVERMKAHLPFACTSDKQVRKGLTAALAAPPAEVKP